MELKGNILLFFSPGKPRICSGSDLVMFNHFPNKIPSIIPVTSEDGIAGIHTLLLVLGNRDVAVTDDV